MYYINMSHPLLIKSKENQAQRPIDEKPIEKIADKKNNVAINTPKNKTITFFYNYEKQLVSPRLGIENTKKEHVGNRLEEGKVTKNGRIRKDKQKFDKWKKNAEVYRGIGYDIPEGDDKYNEEVYKIKDLSKINAYVSPIYINDSNKININIYKGNKYYLDSVKEHQREQYCIEEGKSVTRVNTGNIDNVMQFRKSIQSEKENPFNMLTNTQDDAGYYRSGYQTRPLQLKNKTIVSPGPLTSGSVILEGSSKYYEDAPLASPDNNGVNDNSKYFGQRAQFVTGLSKIDETPVHNMLIDEINPAGKLPAEYNGVKQIGNTKFVASQKGLLVLINGKWEHVLKGTVYEAVPGVILNMNDKWPGIIYTYRNDGLTHVYLIDEEGVVPLPDLEDELVKGIFDEGICVVLPRNGAPLYYIDDAWRSMPSKETELIKNNLIALPECIVGYHLSSENKCEKN